VRLPLVTAAARQARALDSVDHRPWPLPGRRWSVAQTLTCTATCHWPLTGEALAALLPDGVEPDLHDGRAWVSVVVSRVEGVRLRGTLPPPVVDGGAELVVRAAVRSGGRPATFILDAAYAGTVVAEAALRLYGRAVERSRISVELRDGAVAVEAARTRPGGAPAVFHALLEPGAGAAAGAAPPAPHSLAAFLHDRFLVVALRRDGSLASAEQHRPPWALREVHATVELETLLPAALAGAAPAAAFVGEAVDQLVWAAPPGSPHRER
jgi:uncharacterized protein YqjF (DUF2071 family)